MARVLLVTGISLFSLGASRTVRTK